RGWTSWSRQGGLLPIEVKTTTRPRLRDAAHLRSFCSEYGGDARAGPLLHAGSALEWLALDVLAAPLVESALTGAGQLRENCGRERSTLRSRSRSRSRPLTSFGNGNGRNPPPPPVRWSRAGGSRHRSRTRTRTPTRARAR